MNSKNVARTPPILKDYHFKVAPILLAVKSPPPFQNIFSLIQLSIFLPYFNLKPEKYQDAR